MKQTIFTKQIVVTLMISMALSSCGQTPFTTKDSPNASQEMNENHQMPTNGGDQNNLAPKRASDKPSHDALDSNNPEKELPTAMPYYCDPLRYPPNIINNITACKPFLGMTPSSYYSAGPIGYRMRWDLLYPGLRYRNDGDHRRRGSWRNHHNRFDNNNSKHFNGGRRSGRP